MAKIFTTRYNFHRDREVAVDSIVLRVQLIIYSNHRSSLIDHVSMYWSSAGHRPGGRGHRRRQRGGAEAVGGGAGHVVAARRPAPAVRGRLLRQGRPGRHPGDHRAPGAQVGQDLLHRSVALVINQA